MTSTSAEPDVNIHETRVPAVASVVTVLTALSILCVSLRFWVRRTRRGGLWIDDWLILLGMILSVAVSLIMLRQIPRGYGRHMAALPPDMDMRPVARDIYIAQILYFLGTGVIKISILFFYLRLTPRLQVAVWTTIALVGASTIALTLGNILGCWPVAYAWGGETSGSCFNRWVFWTAGAAINVFTDLIVYTMPLPTIWRSKMLRRRQKIALILVFGVGLFAVITGILRLVALVENPDMGSKKMKDPLWKSVLGSTWSVAELHSGIISACLPSLKPLFGRMFASAPPTPAGRKPSVSQAGPSDDSKRQSDPYTSQEEEEGKDIRNTITSICSADQSSQSNPHPNLQIPFFHKPLRRESDRSGYASDVEQTVTTVITPASANNSVSPLRSLTGDWPTQYGHNNRVSNHAVHVQGNYSGSPPGSSSSEEIDNAGEGSSRRSGVTGHRRMATSSSEVATSIGRSRSVSGTETEDPLQPSQITPYDRLSRKYSDSGNNVIIKTTKISVSRSASVHGAP